MHILILIQRFINSLCYFKYYLSNSHFKKMTFYGVCIGIIDDS